MIKLYGSARYGNTRKIILLAQKLGLAFELVEVDTAKGETRNPAFLALSPKGKVPIIELDDGRVLAESNAILRYLAGGSSLLPQDAFLQAKIDEWLFWEQYSHEPYVAVCISDVLYRGKTIETRDSLRVARAETALDLMDEHLAQNPFLAGESLTIADVALFPYTSQAEVGGFSLAARPHLQNWLNRVAQELG